MNAFIGCKLSKQQSEQKHFGVWSHDLCEIMSPYSKLLPCFFRSVQDNLNVQTFTFDQSFQPYEKDDFVLVRKLSYDFILNCIMTYVVSCFFFFFNSVMLSRKHYYIAKGGACI